MPFVSFQFAGSSAAAYGEHAKAMSDPYGVIGFNPTLFVFEPPRARARIREELRSSSLTMLRRQLRMKIVKRIFFNSILASTSCALMYSMRFSISLTVAGMSVLSSQLYDSMVRAFDVEDRHLCRSWPAM